jgi:uncharacterized protein YeaO (DUF488 family)
MQHSSGLRVSSKGKRLQVKRAYEEPAASDGFRVLVDRLWPRGLTKEKARIDLWLREIAPSNELRKWYGHDSVRWTEFKRRYYKEIAGRPEVLEDLRRRIAEGMVTLVYSSKETKLNDAVALAEFLER